MCVLFLMLFVMSNASLKKVKSQNSGVELKFLAFSIGMIWFDMLHLDGKGKKYTVSYLSLLYEKFETFIRRFAIHGLKLENMHVIFIVSVIVTSLFHYFKISIIIFCLVFVNFFFISILLVPPLVLFIFPPIFLLFRNPLLSLLASFTDTLPSM